METGKSKEKDPGKRKSRGMEMILETNVVDAVGFTKDLQTEVFGIFDHLDWSDEEEHLYLLQEKINTILVFIQGGQKELDPLNKKNLKYAKRMVIEICFKYQPSQECQGFLNRVQWRLKNMKNFEGIKDTKLMKNAERLENVEITYIVKG